LPTFLLDTLIALNITGALLILLTSMFVSGRSILGLSGAAAGRHPVPARAEHQRHPAGAARRRRRQGDPRVRQLRGRGQPWSSGLVIFLILIIVQIVVVTKGAERVAEVGARFTLDAMPGKQMAIDADLNAGLIDEAEAKQRRADVAAEADFYGAMDGGSKFVKGDAIAAIIITLINLIGGFAVGILQQGMSPPTR
jgi:flagellar biosynthesis protein FlhA